MVFETDNDRLVYLGLLQQHARLQRLAILGYCLMPNHVHLIVVPQREGSLRTALRNAHGRYAAYLNARQATSGHVWQGRYYSCPMDDDHLWTRPALYRTQSGTRRDGPRCRGVSLVERAHPPGRRLGRDDRPRPVVGALDARRVARIPRRRRSSSARARHSGAARTAAARSVPRILWSAWKSRWRGRSRRARGKAEEEVEPSRETAQRLLAAIVNRRKLENVPSVPGFHSSKGLGGCAPSTSSQSSEPSDIIKSLAPLSAPRPCGLSD